MNVDLTTILVITGAIIAGVVLSSYAGKVEIEREATDMSALAPKQICAVMSALGQKRTVAVQQSMSAFRPKRTFQSALRLGLPKRPRGSR